MGRLPFPPGAGPDGPAAKLACTLAGTGSTVLLLHGAFLSRPTWEGLADALAPAYRVVAPDLPGHGDSTRGNGAYSIGGFADTVRGVLDRLRVERAHVCGHSLGGWSPSNSP